MPASLDCYLCLLRQSLEAARFATNDETVQQKVLADGMRRVLDSGMTTPPPIIGREIHRLIKSVTGNQDPYAEEKARSNRTMLAQLETMRRRIKTASDPFEMAVRLAIAGNSIDNALGVLDPKKIEQAFDAALSVPINGSADRLRQYVESANWIFYLTDNAGEIICDRLLIELITQKWQKPVTVAVRGKPIINDATLEDGKIAGLAAMPLVELIDNGNDGLGTFLNECSPEFLRHFTEDSLVIAKGLANYETLVENKSDIQPKRITYLFKAKCPFISRYAGTKMGDLVVRIFPE